MTLDEKRKQVAAQCKAVSHMAKAIAQVHDDHARMLDAGAGPWDDILDIRGKFTASRMEALGNILNNMDAVTEDDDWVQPIFAKAQELWPVTQ